MSAPHGAHHQRRGPPLSADTCLYLYAVTFQGAPIEAGPGVDGRSGVRPVAWGGLEAHASPVPADEFGAEALRRRVQDPHQLEELARRHQRVIQQVHGARTALPFPLGALCADEQAAARLLEENHGPLLAELLRLKGCDEWGVKLFADRRQTEAAPAEAAASPAGVGAGRAFLMRKQAALEHAARAGALLATVANRAYEELTPLAEEVQPGDLTIARLGAHPPGAELVFNAAFLVARARSEEFMSGVRRFTASESGLSSAVSGPWAPYSFVRALKGELS